MKNFFLILSIAIGLTAYGQPGKGFQFVESSTGMNYPTWESGMTELEFADINMDGYVDILSIGDHGCPGGGNLEHGIMVWFGDGQGNWAAQMTGNFGYGGIAIGDVNNDGIWDVGYGMHHNYSGSDLGNQLMEVALGDGTGIGWTAWDDGLGQNGQSWGMFGTDFADINNDGYLDIGSNSFGTGDGVHVYLNQGDGSWTQSFGFFAGNSNLRFVFGDINNDGNADFVVTNEAGTAYFGDGTGNFTSADYNLPTDAFIGGPDLGDVNHDGGQDLAYATPNGGVNVWVFDTGASQWVNFSGTLPVSGGYQEVQLADFNGDGMLDLAAFGDAHLTVWSGTLNNDQSITWTQEFTITTSNNGDCAALRAGGDVDRNGFPDITLVEKVGSWPNDINHLKCYKETSPFTMSSLRSVFPMGQEVFWQEAALFTDWISAVQDTATALVKIDLSLQGIQGPWTTLSEGASNSGRFQWTAPATISSNNCYFRYSLINGEDSLVTYTPEPFTILGEDDVMADFIAIPTQAYPNDEIQFTDQSLGLITSWQWDLNNDGTVDATNRNPTWSYSQPGSYTVKLTVSDGTAIETEIKTDYITILPHVALDEKDISGDLSVGPNPCRDFLILRYRISESRMPGENTGMAFDLLDINNKCVDRFLDTDTEPGIHEKKIEVGHLPIGAYLYRLQAGGQMKTGKLLKIN